MVEDNTDDSASLHSIFKNTADDDLDANADASTTIDESRLEEQQDAASDAPGHETTSEEPITQSRRGFGKLMLAGATGALSLSQANTARADGGGWRERYRKYAQEYVPEFYKSVPKQDNLYKCVRYVAENTKFWEKLGEKMYLDQAVVTAAYAYPVLNYKEVEQKAWDGILSDMYADMPKKYKKKRKYPIAVPVVVVYLYDGYYNAVAYLRPYGKSYKSYGYIIKSGYYQKKAYNSKSDYKSNTWWWTEDGMGDASVTEGGILDGVPTSLTD